MKDSFWFFVGYVFCVEWSCNVWLLNELEVAIVPGEKNVFNFWYGSNFSSCLMNWMYREEEW